MKKSNMTQITIPSGHFEGNCYTCFHIQADSMDEKGSILCKQYNERRFPLDMCKCPRYVHKIKAWLTIGVGAYLLLTFIVVVFEIMFK